ncbi:MAG TPA: C1 family peptidase, partial [Candidatus Baltobacteraceae bacterium]|nr:C1 family peptidase [Candidatus Baltobacteraceae bacterium]
AGALEFDQSTPFWTPSRLFVYFNERVIEGTVNSDSGAMLRDGIKSVSSQGVCKEDEWPYVISKFEVQPFQQCYTDALSYVATSYHSLNQDITEFKSCLAEGFPFVYGFTAYDAFESASVAQTGVLNMPAPTERVVGGHAVLAVGYDDPSQRFIVRNSWGADWGNAGYFTVPYDYLLDPNLASDFWTIRTAGAAGN